MLPQLFDIAHEIYLLLLLFLDSSGLTPIEISKDILTNLTGLILLINFPLDSNRILDLIGEINDRGMKAHQSRLILPDSLLALLKQTVITPDMLPRQLISYMFHPNIPPMHDREQIIILHILKEQQEGIR